MVVGFLRLKKISFPISLINEALDTVSLGVQMWAMRQKCKRAAGGCVSFASQRDGAERGRGRERQNGERREEREGAILC